MVNTSAKTAAGTSAWGNNLDSSLCNMNDTVYHTRNYSIGRCEMCAAHQVSGRQSLRRAPSQSAQTRLEWQTEPFVTVMYSTTNVKRF